jgi:hypothetical protein
MAQSKLDSENIEALKENEKKWSKPLMAAGWSAVPNILLEKQEALGLKPLEMNIILHLIQYWWFKTNLPGNHPIFRWIENWTSGRCFQFHCGRNTADGHVWPLVVVCP